MYILEVSAYLLCPKFSSVTFAVWPPVGLGAKTQQGNICVANNLLADVIQAVGCDVRAEGK